MTIDGSGQPNGLLVNHDYMAVKLCRHGTFLFNRNDTFVGQSLELYGEWCEAEIFILNQIIRPGSVVLDVGANIGTHTVPFAKKVGDSGRVYAFEPQRLVYQTLCANVAINALRNVLTFQQAVGDQPSQIKVPVIDPRHKYNFAAVSVEEHSIGDEVAVIPIDSIPFRDCHLIKVDVEGMEVPVLEGARKTINRFRPVLFVENNTVERSRRLLEMIESLGYTAYWQLANYYNPRNYLRNSTNVFAEYKPEANLLCFHNSESVKINGFQKVKSVEDDWLQAATRASQSAEHDQK